MTQSPTPLTQASADTITIQEAWEAAGGNPGIKATKADLLASLKMLDAVCDEAAAEDSAKGAGDHRPSPLIVTRDGIPLPDQAEAIRQFKAACLVRPDRQQHGGDVDERAAFEQAWKSRPFTRASTDKDRAFFWWNKRAALDAQPAVSAEPVAVPKAIASTIQRALVAFSDAELARLRELQSPKKAASNLYGVGRIAAQKNIDDADAALNWLATPVTALAAHKPDGGDAKDAERYRWLRDAHPADQEGLWVAHGLPGRGLDCWRNEELDAAIDAAIAQQRKEGK